MDHRLSRNWTRWMLLALVCGVLGLATTSSAQWQENYCPGSPYNCVPYEACNDLLYCVYVEGEWCSYPLVFTNFVWAKHYMIKQCTNTEYPYDEVYCASCGDPGPTGECCATEDPSSPMCPDEPNCIS